MEISSLEASQLNQIKYFRCSKEKQASMYCLNSQCLKQNPFTCVDFNCQCQQNHEECEARAMIDVTLKRIKQKLNPSDKFKNDIENRFDKIIDEMSEMRDKVITEWGERIKTQGLSDIEKQFLSFSQGKQQNCVFSTKKLIALSKSIKVKSENGTVVTNQIFQKIKQIQNKLKYGLQILTFQLQAIKNKYPSSSSDHILKQLKQLSKDIMNPAMFNEFINKKDIEFEILSKRMHLQRPTKSQKLKIKIFDMQIGRQYMNLFLQNLNKLKIMVLQSDIMQDIGIFFELFYEVYLNLGDDKLQKSKLSYQTRYCRINVKNCSLNELMYQANIQKQANEYKIAHKQKFTRAKFQKITVEQFKQSIKGMKRYYQKNKEQIINYLAKNIQKYNKKQYLLLIVIDLISLQSMKSGEIKYMFAMEDIQGIYQRFTQKQTNQLQQLLQCIQLSLSKFIIFPE